MTRQRIVYFGTKTLVAPGDRVRLRRWFRWVEGVVRYVPGISPDHPILAGAAEDSVAEVGIETYDGRVYGIFVYPAGYEAQGALSEKVRFETRGISPPPLPDDIDDPINDSSRSD